MRKGRGLALPAAFGQGRYKEVLNTKQVAHDEPDEQGDQVKDGDDVQPAGMAYFFIAEGEDVKDAQEKQEW